VVGVELAHGQARFATDCPSSEPARRWPEAIRNLQMQRARPRSGISRFLCNTGVMYRDSVRKAIREGV